MIKQRRAYEVDGKIFMKKVEAVEYVERLNDGFDIGLDLQKASKLIRKSVEKLEKYECEWLHFGIGTDTFI